VAIIQNEKEIGKKGRYRLVDVGYDHLAIYLDSLSPGEHYMSGHKDQVLKMWHQIDPLNTPKAPYKKHYTGFTAFGAYIDWENNRIGVLK